MFKKTKGFNDNDFFSSYILTNASPPAVVRSNNNNTTTTTLMTSHNNGSPVVDDVTSADSSVCSYFGGFDKNQEVFVNKTADGAYNPLFEGESGICTASI